MQAHAGQQIVHYFADGGGVHYVGIISGVTRGGRPKRVAQASDAPLPRTKVTVLYNDGEFDHPLKECDHGTHWNLIRPVVSGPQGCGVAHRPRTRVLTFT